MRNPRWSLTGLLACTLPAACADPCLDDGLGQSDGGNCPAALDGGTDTATETESNTNTMTNTMGSATMGSNTESMSGSQTGETVTETLDGTETAGGTLWCVDADGDGFGDPDMCTQSDDMPPGTVDNDDDCDDTNPNTFPGAAELDDPRACMNDDDDDGWGDDGNGGEDLPPGVEPGSDCDDENPDTFPGAAELDDPRACMNDADDDGWGDSNPGGGGGGGDRGPVSGSDCYDTNPLLNPDTVRLSAFIPYNAGAGAPRNLVYIEPDASFGENVVLSTPMGGIPNVNIVSATFNEDLEIFGNDLTSVQLEAVEYLSMCDAGTGTVTPVGTPYEDPGNIVCGLEFGSNGQLYGISHTEDDLRVFDTRSGQIVGEPIPVTLEDGAFLDVFSCGMARDCTEGRLLLANGVDRIILGIDEETGVAQVLRDLSAFFPSTWNPTGLEYDPVTRTALLSTGNELYRVNLDDDSDPELLGDFATPISNLQNLPFCM